MLLKTTIQFSQYLGARSWLGIVDTNIYESGYLGYTLRETVPQVTIMQTKVLLLEKSIMVKQ